MAIERAINREIERRKPGPQHNCRQDFGDNSDHRIQDESSRLSGFGNRETARQARTVVEKGTPELVAAMDEGHVSISAAADLAALPPDEQKARVDLPTPRVAKRTAAETGNAVLARDGRGLRAGR